MKSGANMLMTRLGARQREFLCHLFLHLHKFTPEGPCPHVLLVFPGMKLESGECSALAIRLVTDYCESVVVCQPFLYKSVSLTSRL